MVKTQASNNRGAPRFELGTSCSQSRSQRSSHPTQNGRLAIILKLKALLVLGGFVWERLEAWGFWQLRFYLHSLFPRRRAGLQFADLQGSRVGLIDNYEPEPGSWLLVQVPEIQRKLGIRHRVVTAPALKPITPDEGVHFILRQYRRLSRSCALLLGGGAYLPGCSRSCRCLLSRCGGSFLDGRLARAGLGRA